MKAAIAFAIIALAVIAIKPFPWQTKWKVDISNAIV